MGTQAGPKILVVCESVVDTTMLLVLLSAISQELATTTTYEQGCRLLEEAERSGRPFELVFVAYPPHLHEDIDNAVKVLALALRDCGPGRTIVLGGEKLPPQFLAQTGDENVVLTKPITRQKLAALLAPLALELPRRNCWEYMECGRQPGGRHVADQGVCPAATEEAAAGMHGGTCGGRVCWAISGTLCGGTVQGSFACKIENCMQCDFYKLVQHEEGDVFESIDSIMNRLRRKRQLLQGRNLDKAADE